MLEILPYQKCLTGLRLPALKALIPILEKKMKHLFIAFTTLVLFSCNGNQNDHRPTIIKLHQENLNNEKIRNHNFLYGMYTDNYFPKFLVDKVRLILIELCYNIENNSPKNLEELYALTHASTDKINDLQDEFYTNQSEIETFARESIAVDFEFISNSYGFKADIEELIANRDW